MPPKALDLSPAEFEAEARRRLIDTFDLMLMLGLRSKQAVWKRVEAGKLPKPLLVKANIVALWDRDAIAELNGAPDRKED